MSLIKIATFISENSSTVKNIKNFFSKTEGSPFKQRAALTGFANAEANVRKGATHKPTFLGRLINKRTDNIGGNTIDKLEEIHKGNEREHKLAKKILSKTITNEGKYDIGEIERLLNKSNKAYGRIEKAHKIPTTTIGAISGGAIGYARSNDENKKKSTIKGALIGGSIGGAIRQGIGQMKKELWFVPKAHKEYFADNYWKDQLTKANNEKELSSRIGKFTSNQFTSNSNK